MQRREKSYYERMMFGVFLVLLCFIPALAVAAPFAYITNAGSDTVSVIDTATNTVIGAPIAVRDTPIAFGLFIGGPAATATSTAIPTMTEWGMIFFVVLAGLGAVYYLGRKRRTEN